MLKTIIGSVILLFGVINMGFAVYHLPPGAGFEFIIGNLLPAGLITVAGVVILSWKKRGS